MKKYLIPASAALGSVIASVPVFAEGTTTSALVTAADLSPITSQLTATAEVVVPFGLGVLAVFTGIKFIPRLIRIFTGR